MLSIFYGKIFIRFLRFFLKLVTEDSDCPISQDSVQSTSAAISLQTAPLVIHVYRLVSGDEADPTHETIEVSSEVIKGGTRWALPSPEFDGLWDSLVYDSTVKRDLLKYSESALLFADYEVSFHLFWCECEDLKDITLFFLSIGQPTRHLLEPRHFSPWTPGYRQNLSLPGSRS